MTQARYSIPYFAAPDHEAVVEVLPSTVTPEHPAQYAPVAWKDYDGWRGKHAYKERSDVAT